MQASNQKLDRIENRIRSLENRSDKASQEKSIDRRKVIGENDGKGSPYHIDASPAKSPVNPRENNSLAEDSRDTINRNEKSPKRKKKTKSKKKDAEN